MENLMTIIKMFFWGSLVVSVLFVVCLVKIPSFREFCDRLITQLWKTTVFSVLAVFFVFLYIISPVDLIPDIIPIFGQLDDLGVFLSSAFIIPAKMIHAFKVVINAKPQLGA